MNYSLFNEEVKHGSLAAFLYEGEQNIAVYSLKITDPLFHMPYEEPTAHTKLRNPHGLQAASEIPPADEPNWGSCIFPW